MKSSRSRTARIIFITGTDTGVGKTLLSGLLLHHLRESGVRALAIKPFCSGGTGDVRFLSAIQNHELPADKVNPFYFPEALAPLVSARKHRRKIRLNEAVTAINDVSTLCDCLIVEGSGGLRVPLGEGFDVAKLIQHIDCEVIVVARNKLGVINHTLLTVDAVRGLGIRKVRVVLMGSAKKDASSATNVKILEELLRSTKVFSLTYFGKNAQKMQLFLNIPKKIKKTLARIGG